jgi:hypothetical protein
MVGDKPRRITQVGLGKYKRNLRIFKQRDEVFMGIVQIKRDISPSSFKNSQQRYHKFQRTLHVYPNQFIWPNTLIKQTIGQLIGLIVELLVGQLLLLKDHCDGFRTLLYLQFKELVHTYIL